MLKEAVPPRALRCCAVCACALVRLCSWAWPHSGEGLEEDELGGGAVRAAKAYHAAARHVPPPRQQRKLASVAHGNLWCTRATG